MIPRLFHLTLQGAMAVAAFCLTACCQAIPAPMPTLADDSFRSYDGREFGYQSWVTDSDSDVIVIGVHGINGHARDYRMLGKRILETKVVKALFAYELRGQGLDPVEADRGDIRDARHWYRDLMVFSQLIADKHPGSRIVWMGESLGSLIVSNAFAVYSKQGKTPSAGIILSSPIGRLRSDFPRWKVVLARAIATAFPLARLSLESLSGDDEVRVTEKIAHSDQAQINEWHVERHTFRSLKIIGDLIDGMADAASEFDQPILIMNGGNDVFSAAVDVENLVREIPDQSLVTHKHFPASFHLLFYDHESEKVIDTTIDWLRAFSDQAAK